MKWEPIETAPKDGTVVLVCGGDVDRKASEAGQRCIISIYDDFIFDSWVSTGGRNDKVHPTHWMPLPLPPSV